MGWGHLAQGDVATAFLLLTLLWRGATVGGTKALHRAGRARRTAAALTMVMREKLHTDIDTQGKPQEGFFEEMMGS